MRARVLVIDDDPDCLLMIENMLGQAGFAVCTATNHREALDSIRTARPDVILLELVPQADGIDLLERLKSAPLSRGIPVVIVSARGLDEDRLADCVAGADHYVAKPFTSRQLRYGIERVLVRAAARDKPPRAMR